MPGCGRLAQQVVTGTSHPERFAPVLQQLESALPSGLHDLVRGPVPDGELIGKRLRAVVLLHSQMLLIHIGVLATGLHQHAPLHAGCDTGVALEELA